MSEAAPGADFESFVLETIEAFSRLARAQAGDLHGAQDAVQDVYRRWDLLTAGQGSLTAYGRTAVKRAVIDQFRRNKRMVRVLLREQGKYARVACQRRRCWCMQTRNPRP